METARGRRWPFAARDTEFAQLTAEDARSAVLIGEPGAGKTRLLAELAAHLDTADRRVIHVGATSSLASVPFGAFAGVLSIGFEEGSPFETLVRALDALTGGRPEDLVLAVDDAHLLDDASAGLVLLAARAGSRILATAREREPSPDAITRLWKDDFAQRIDLQLLDEERLGVLLHAALRGPLDSHSLYRLHDVTRGNLLFIRELVDRAVDNGSLVERDGIWSWTVALIDAPSVHDLARERLASVPAETMTLVEFLAVGEPFGLAVVDRLCEPGALAAGEAAGLVVWREAGSRRELRLVHPLYAEVIRDAMGVAGRANRSAAVAEALASTGARRRDDRLRVAVLCLDAGTPGDPAELRAAALQAVGRADLGLAERLARAPLSMPMDRRPAN